MKRFAETYTYTNQRCWEEEHGEERDGDRGGADVLGFGGYARCEEVEFRGCGM